MFKAIVHGSGCIVSRSSLSHTRRDNADDLPVIEGVITIALGILVAFVLPDFPHTWRLLSPEMKAVAIRRMALDAREADVDVGGGMSQIAGMKAAVSHERKDTDGRFRTNFILTKIF